MRSATTAHNSHKPSKSYSIVIVQTIPVFCDVLCKLAASIDADVPCVLKAGAPFKTVALLAVAVVLVVVRSGTNVCIKVKLSAPICKNDSDVERNCVSMHHHAIKYFV